MLKQHVKYNTPYTIYKNLTYFIFSTVLVCLLFAPSLRSMNKKAFSAEAAMELMKQGKYSELKSWMDYWVRWQNEDAFSWLVGCANHGSAFGIYSYLRAAPTMKKGKNRLSFSQYEIYMARLLVIVAYNLILYAYIHKNYDIVALKFKIFKNKVNYWLGSLSMPQDYRPFARLVNNAIAWLNQKTSGGKSHDDCSIEPLRLLLDDYFWVAHCDTTMMGGLCVTDRTASELQRYKQVKDSLQKNYTKIRSTILNGIREIFITKMIGLTTLKEFVTSKKELEVASVYQILFELPTLYRSYVEVDQDDAVGAFEQVDAKLSDVKERSQRLANMTQSEAVYEKNKQEFSVHLAANDPLSMYFFIRYVLNNTSVLEEYISDDSYFYKLAEYTMHFMYRVAVDIIMTSILCDDMTILKKFKDVFCKKIWVYYFQRDSRTADLLKKIHYNEMFHKVDFDNKIRLLTQSDQSDDSGWDPCIWVTGVNWIGADSYFNYSKILAFNDPSDATQEMFKKGCEEYHIDIMRDCIAGYVSLVFRKFENFKGLFESSDPFDIKRLRCEMVDWKRKCKAG